MNLGIVIRRIRRNHALEHATISVLIKENGAGMPLAGNATPGGFYIYGNIPTEKVALAIADALQRLRDGESGMAVSPYCGTNLVVAAVLAGLSSAIALGNKNRLRNLPSAFSAALVALIAARPLGRWVQRYYTTLADMDGLQVVGITRKGLGSHTIHRVRTRIEE